MKSSPIVLQEISADVKVGVKSELFYEFSDFRLVPNDCLLTYKGEIVPLPPKAFSTLLFLIENHGHLVTKVELIDAIWTDSFVEEGALSRCIFTIRHASMTSAVRRRPIQAPKPE